MTEVPNRGSFSVNDAIRWYNRNAHSTASRNENVAFESVHNKVMDLLPGEGSSILDVGAGSGRDASWFYRNGYQVSAIEPSAELRRIAIERHRKANIRWFDDRLPTLEKVLKSKLTFDLIWVNAVWHHIPKNEQRRALRKLVSVLSPGGSMMVSLRDGDHPADYPSRSVTSGELEQLARDFGLFTVRVQPSEDALERKNVNWEVVWFRLPDDGTNALPLLRHVVFNDSKSSTYKLALLRVLVRIADGASGYARFIEEREHIELPLGLLGLFWIRAFQPLVFKRLPQLPNGMRMSFAKEAFEELVKSTSPYDLRPGQQVVGDQLKTLRTAISEASQCILRMPVKHITFPGSTETVFYRSSRAQRSKTKVQRIDEAFLWSFGGFSLPQNLWQAMSRYTPWIEPAIEAEWILLMQKYQKDRPSSWDSLRSSLRWMDVKHETSLVRKRVENLTEHGKSIFCIWTGKRLRRNVEIDHCFPFAAWPCNDLWNLLPSQPKVNRSKSDRLPTLELLDKSRSRIGDWWTEAYFHTNEMQNRFLVEATSALPNVSSESGSVTVDSVFEALLSQQMVLKRDQKLREWEPTLAMSVDSN